MNKRWQWLAAALSCLVPPLAQAQSTYPFRPLQLVVGFAAETENVIEHARRKLAKKKCDLIVANDVSPASGVMGGDLNEVHLVAGDGVENWPRLAKDEVARRLVAAIAARLGSKR